MFKCRENYSASSFKEALIDIYEILLKEFGRQGWWPGDSNLEMIIGAILTQAVSWQNAFQAINNLKKNNLLTVADLLRINREELAKQIKPAGYYNEKAKKLKAFADFLDENYRGKLSGLLSRPPSALREELLGIYGIGPETADSIMVYAAGYPSFVIDAYTRRIFNRLGYIEKDLSYHSLQDKIEKVLPDDIKIYNEYHALLVKLGKEFCKKSEPRCGDCPLAKKQNY